LVSLNSNIDEFTKIGLIVTGLPFSVQERIDIAETTTVSKLLSKLNSLERSPQRSQFGASSSSKITRSSSNVIYENSAFGPARSPTGSSAFTSLRRLPCTYCKTKGFERFHSEQNCRTKVRDLSLQSQNNDNHCSTASNVQSKLNSLESEYFSEIEKESKNA